MPAPLFSIVTVCLNAGESLSRTVQSVLAQHGKDFEYVVKDGGSVDRSISALPKDPRVRLLARADTGIFEAMNQALEICQGDYVLFLNAGDVFCGRNVLTELRAFLGKTRPEVFYTFYEYGSPGNVFKYPKQLTRNFLYRRSICHQVTFVRRDCYTRFGDFNTSFRVVADDELLARLILKHHVSHLLVPLPAVRVEEWKFTAKPGNSEQVQLVRNYIRERYMTSGQRWKARLVYAATFPGIRRKWLSAPQGSSRYRLYVTLSNFVNQRL